MRRVYLKAGALTAGIADQFANTNLTVHADPDITVRVTRDKLRGMENGLGGEIPNYMVRVGQWVKVADKDPLVVVKTHWTNKGDFSCDLGKSAQYWETLVSYLQEVTRHVVMGTNPLTGARA